MDLAAVSVPLSRRLSLHRLRRPSRATNLCQDKQLALAPRLQFPGAGGNDAATTEEAVALSNRTEDLAPFRADDRPRQRRCDRRHHWRHQVHETAFVACFRYDSTDAPPEPGRDARRRESHRRSADADRARRATTERKTLRLSAHATIYITAEHE